MQFSTYTAGLLLLFHTNGGAERMYNYLKDVCLYYFLNAYSLYIPIETESIRNH